jgi:hypothetical protein
MKSLRKEKNIFVILKMKPYTVKDLNNGNLSTLAIRTLNSLIISIDGRRKVNESLSLTWNELKQLIEFNYNLETTFFKKVLRQEPLCLKNIEPENKEYFMEY